MFRIECRNCLGKTSSAGSELKVEKKGTDLMARLVEAQDCWVPRYLWRHRVTLPWMAFLVGARFTSVSFSKTTVKVGSVGTITAYWKCCWASLVSVSWFVSSGRRGSRCSRCRRWELCYCSCKYLNCFCKTAQKAGYICIALEVGCVEVQDFTAA